MTAFCGLSRCCLTLYLVAVLFNRHVSAQVDVTTQDVCLYACYDWTDHITWELPPKIKANPDYYFQLCAFELKYRSILYCAQAYCSDAEISSGWSILNKTCMVEAGIALPDYELYTLSASRLEGIERSSEAAEKTTAKQAVGKPVIPNRSWFALSQHTDVISNPISSSFTDRLRMLTYSVRFLRQHQS